MEEPRQPRYAGVAVLAQLGRAGGLFTYAVPERLSAMLGPGSLVRVPFAQRMCQGVVCSLETSSDLARVRELAELLDPIPVVTPHGLQLARWISKYYAAPLSDILAAMLPPGLGRKSVSVLQPGVEADGARLSAGQRAVLEAVRDVERISLDALQRRLPDVDVERAVASLLRRHLLIRFAELAPPRVSSRVVRLVYPTERSEAALDNGALKRAPRQRHVLHQLVSSGPLPLQRLSQLAPGSRSVIPALEAKGLVEIREQEQTRSPLERLDSSFPPPPALSEPQRQAYSAIAGSVARSQPDIYLLHGVTGSGKTEVYLQAIAQTIRQGQQAIMMVPEISLTPQAVERVAGRFPGRVAVLHSGLTPGERVDEWQRIRHGEADVVVGARSALFAPLARPGLIVVDEEHDPSYKQDASPRYNARDAATVLSRLTGATVVLGSATPDVVTFRAARSGRIKLLELPNRPVWGADGADRASRSMPEVEVVDMRQELKSGNRGIFSGPLLDGVDSTLAAGHQALLFLNRRGSATVVMCRDCGYVVRCPHCDIPYTYHAAATRLICHRCDKRAPIPRTCPACGSPRIRYLGAGTQRVEEEVRRLFPSARVLRWDRDVTGGKDAHGEILRRFARREADILVGTQMIAKGLDFPRVTLVGVISADTGLHLPDFRAPERSFQLLTQVAGRAGRSSLASRVVVQTYTPDHYAIQAAREHDYHRFYQDEISFRESAGYPPFARLVRFIYSSERESDCQHSAGNLRAILSHAVKVEAAPEVELIGPAPCFATRVKNRYYWQLIARAPEGAGRAALHRLLDYVPAGWAIDVDPIDLL